MLNVCEKKSSRKRFIRVIFLFSIFFLGMKTSYAVEAGPQDQFKDPQKRFEYVYKTVYDFAPSWAVYTLGQYYDEGYGTRVDVIKAYVFYKMAAQTDVKGAADSLSELKAHMTSAQITQAEALFTQINNQFINKAIKMARPRVE